MIVITGKLPCAQLQMNISTRPRRYFTVKNIFFSILFLFFLFPWAPAYAHSLWLNIDNHQAKPGQKVHIGVGWGHKFPKDEIIKEKFLNQVYAIDAKGVKISLKQLSQTEFEFVPEAEGTYTIVANIHPGFLSKTTDGYKLKAKKGLDNVLSCFRFDIRAKAIINVGNCIKIAEQKVGDPLEIIPLKNPNKLIEGELFPLKVLYDGKALPYAKVKATYAGFSDQPNTFAFVTKADKEGVAQIRILKKGRWVVNVLHEVPYPDPEKCDKYRYNYCFTFQVEE